MENKILCPRETLIDKLRTRELQVVVTMGAGDIDRSVPAIVSMLNEYGNP
jgi:hypothetical protein